MKNITVEGYLQNLQEVEPLLIAAVAFGFINAINLTYQTYQKYLSKNARRCSQLSVNEKSVCMMILKIQGKKQQLIDLRKTLKLCPKSKKPQKCKKKISQKITESQMDIINFTKRIKQIKKRKETMININFKKLKS